MVGVRKMTIERAIKHLEVMKREQGCYAPITYNIVFDMAIEALEKTIAKAPVYGDYDEDDDDEELIPYKATCPTCEYEFEFGTWNEEENHHCVCGQKMRWDAE